jgi:competence protein ComEA
MICPVDPDSRPQRTNGRHPPALTPPAVPRLPPESPAAPATLPPAAAPGEEQAAAGPRPGESWLWLTRSDQAVVAVLAAGALVLMFVHWGRLSGWGSRPVEIEQLQPRPYQYLIDVNRAGWVELALLEGIGETLARRIVADREQNGPFASVEDLRRVRGIGPKTLDRIRPRVRVSPVDPP